MKLNLELPEDGDLDLDRLKNLNRRRDGEDGGVAWDTVGCGGGGGGVG